jgi:hypothetical protein
MAQWQALLNGVMNTWPVEKREIYLPAKKTKFRNEEPVPSIWLFGLMLFGKPTVLYCFSIV